MRINARLALAVCLFSFVSTPALANIVDNPGNFVWTTGTGDLVFNKATPITKTVPTTASGLDIDLDSNGNITWNSVSFASVTISGYTVTFLVSAGASNGKILASNSGYNSTFDLSVRIRVTGNGVTSATACTTAAAVRHFEGAYQYTSGTTAGDLRIYSGLGGSGGNDGWLTIPTLPSTGCSGLDGTLNSLLGLGVTNGSLQVNRLGATMGSGAPRGS